MNIKKYLPFENYVLTTRLPVMEVIKRLHNNIEISRGLQLSHLNNSSGKPYTGEITSSTFKMSRIINYRNSFLPQITGEITSFLDETQIIIKMQPVTFVLIFMSFWLGTVGLACLGILLTGLSQLPLLFSEGFSPFVLIPFVMFVFGCLLCTLAFKTEAKKSKAFLEQLLEGQENR
ncbi:hypothetical protein [Chitinophaga pinensis]|uniref:Uncharacterized protein n=1 Tax=Chitinophaga pinensis (strain ATCC 43595 / DSM 2588 / LMG 13176 / NBRC 15968 / NCIMB 11800 / UQM 2034) TaxID=485918 RepID=A0A979G2G2_CHIPD|nr:hypothetical protein [Chitinophaga pinensis]ACU59576.1 hypothetical protein Cpin_2083 [Chitinophaga pinensis DSM 2588]